jgi:hypothetical protein
LLLLKALEREDWCSDCKKSNHAREIFLHVFCIFIWGDNKDCPSKSLYIYYFSFGFSLSSQCNYIIYIHLYEASAYKDLFTTLTAFSFVFIANNCHSLVFVGLEPMIAIKIFVLFLQQIVGWDSLLRLLCIFLPLCSQPFGKIASCLLKFCGICRPSGYSRSASLHVIAQWIMNNIVCICRPQADFIDHRKRMCAAYTVWTPDDIQERTLLGKTHPSYKQLKIPWKVHNIPTLIKTLLSHKHYSVPL